MTALTVLILINFETQILERFNSPRNERRSVTSRYHGSKISGSQRQRVGSFSNDDGDGNQDVKTTTLHVHHAFLYISLPSMHDYDVKMPYCKFYGGRKQATSNLFFSL